MLKYRADIDGMRALAVVVVLLFHLEIAAFEGGFVGVDVFFVISGFLITTIIWSKASQGTFRFSDFYLRRIRRLVPPLIATVAVSALAASVVLFPEDLAAFARSAIAALASVSNVLFFTEAGYWDTSAELKPLLHTWSLGVEEQFYLVWPALVVGLVAIRRRLSMAASLGLITLVGFLGALWMHAVDPSAAFYLFPFRIFQFSVGALVGFLPVHLVERILARRWSRDALFLVGVGLVAFSVLAFGDTTPFPGWNAVPPTLGAVLLLVSGLRGQGPVGRALLENRPAVWLGKVSYSMYLAHWPIVSLYRYRTGLELTGVEQVGIAVATLIGTIALHYGVERRFYTRDHLSAGSRRVVSPGRFALRTAGVSAIVAVVMGFAVIDDGWAWRFPGLVLEPAQIEQGMQDRLSLAFSGCSLRRIDDPERCDLDRPLQVLVLGNSHERDGYNFLTGAYGEDPDLNLISFGTTNECETITVEGNRFSSDVDDCQLRLDRMMALGDLDWIVYTASRPFRQDRDVFLRLIEGVLDRYPQARLMTMGGYITTSTPCARLINEGGTSRACISPDDVEYFESAPAEWPLFDDFSAITDVYVDRVGLLCVDRRLETCRTESAGGVPMMYDTGHQSLEFALESGEMYARAHPDLLSAAP